MPKSLVWALVVKGSLSIQVEHMAAVIATEAGLGCKADGAAVFLIKVSIQSC